MITYLHGTIAEKHPTRVVVDVGGVGYEVFIPLSSYDQLPATEAECRILIYDYVREDLHQLYGFMTEAERTMFLLLMGVSGIGPRLAMGALSGLSVRELTTSIADGDIKRLSSIQGLGKRTAERIVVDLRDKIEPADVLAAASGTGDTGADHRLHDAMLALISLGYKQAQARKMADGAMRTGKDQELTIEEIIKRALAQ